MGTSDMYTAYLDESLTLTSQGTWVHQNLEFQNQNLIALFHRSIRWDPEEKRFFIQIGKQGASFRVEDTAYFVVRIDDSKYPWVLTLSDESEETLAEETLCMGRAGQFYCRVKEGFRARLSRAAHQVLLSHACSGEAVLIGEKTVTIPRCQDA
jgi:hypothetical protein